MQATANAFDVLTSLMGQRVTIFTHNDFGFPATTHCEIKGVYRKDYAQYRNMIHVVIRPKRKRTDYVIRFYDYKSYLIWSGHVFLNDNPWKETKVSGGVKVQISERCFSGNYIENALNSTDIKPIFSQIKD